MAALRKLTSSGFRVTTKGDKLIVAPSSKLNDELRAYIREHKPALVAEVTSQFRRLSLEDRIQALCAGLPVNAKSVRQSGIFSDDDYKDIEAGEYSEESLKMYIASWLIAGRIFPFVLRHDWAARLGDSM
jgi:hypothetical protein